MDQSEIQALAAENARLRTEVTELLSALATARDELTAIQERLAQQ